MYQRIAGDCRITAKCESIEGIHDWSKAGPMMRETLDSSSSMIIMSITPGNGAALQYRPGDPGYSYNVNDTSFHAPVWLRLTRQGNTFTGSASTDSITWVDVSNTVINMADTFYIGIAYTSHVRSYLGQSVFDSISIYPPTSVIGTGISPAPLPPAVSIYPNPANGQLNINLTTAQATTVKLTLYNAVGQVLYTQQTQCVAGANNLNLNTARYPHGAYLLNIVAGQTTTSQKFVIER